MNAFLSLARTFVIRGLVKNKVRSLLTILGIALGVAVMLAINLANASALGRFAESIDLVSGKATLNIVPRFEADIDENELTKLSWLYDEYIKFTPVIDQVVVSAKEPHEVIQLLGLDLFSSKEFRQYDTDDGENFATSNGENIASKNSADENSKTSANGRAANGSDISTDPSDPSSKPGDVTNTKSDTGTNANARPGPFEIFRRNRILVGSELARRENLKVGDNLNLFLNDKEVSCPVAGILRSEGLGKAFAGNVVLMDIGCAQELLSMKGRISRIDLIVPEDKLFDINSRLMNTLPSSVSAERPERRGMQVQKMLRSFQYNLTALSLIALLVGMFLIYNTMSISVIRRRWEIGTMRALGASMPVVFSLFMGEAIVLGSVGSLLGIGAGVFFAQFALAAVSKTVRALYADQPPGAVIVEPSILLMAFSAGMILTLIAAWAPSMEAISIPPAEAARRASYERKVEKLSPKLALFGLVLLILAFIASLQPAVAGFPFFGYLAAALAVFGAAAITPFALDKTLRLLSPLLGSSVGSEGRLAALSLHGALGRTSVAVASLMVGIAMMVSLAVMISSFRHTVDAWVQQTLRADLWLEPAGRDVSNRAGRLTADIVSKIRQVPGIDSVDAFVEYPIEYHGEPANLGAGELDVMVKHGNLMFLNGEPSSTVLRRVDGHDAGIISESFSLKHNLNVGDQITLQSPNGPYQIRVEGVYYDYSSDSGYIVIPRQNFAKYFNDLNSTTLAIFLQPNVEPEQVRQKIFAAVPSDSRLNIRTNRELKTQVLKIFDNTFSITYALHAISIAVAILGVMNALFALTMESRRDLGIFKYLGASKGQLGKLVIVQAGLLGTLGNLGGLLIGMALSFLLIHVINKQSFGWTVQFFIPFDFLLQSFALIFACSILSGLLPARLAEKTPAAEVVRSE